MNGIKNTKQSDVIGGKRNEQQEIKGQINMFDAFPVRIPCNRPCNVEWCSMVCFKRRGYIWDKAAHSWVYGENGIALRTKARECDWEPTQDREDEGQ